MNIMLERFRISKHFIFPMNACILQPTRYNVSIPTNSGMLTMESDEVTGRAKGGVARANALTQEELKAIAIKGASARWDESIEVAKRAGTIEIGDISIPCAVLEDGTRVLSERAITKAFGGKRGGSHWRRLKENPNGAYLPVFMSAGNIKPFIDNTLTKSLGRRRIYRPKKGGAGAYGIEAALLPKICNVYLKMRDAKVLTSPQAKLSIQADIIMRGLAEIGILALVDEATGYIEEKKKDEYRELFKEFIREQCREWEREVPDQLYDSLFRLYGLPKGVKGRRPQFFGKFTRKYVYAPLANSKGAVLELLDEKNPVVYANGGRKFKMFQFLTELVGLPAFRAHLWQVVGIANASTSKASFDRSFQRAFPQAGYQFELIGEDDT